MLRAAAAVLFLLLWSGAAFASAGFAEYSYVLDYNDRADVWWGANSDICAGAAGKHKNCFCLWSKKKE